MLRVAISFAVWCAAVVFVLGGAWWRSFLEFRSSTEAHETILFEIFPGEGFSEIADRLEAGKVISSAEFLKLYLILSGGASKIQPGLYEFEIPRETGELAKAIVSGSSREAEVRIPEGATIREVDALLVRKGILREGEFIGKEGILPREGTFFPDTYRFFRRSSVDEVLKKFDENFKEKAASLLGTDPEAAHQALTLASLLEKEVPEEEDRRIAAGILLKRLRVGMPLQVDATICYLKKQENPEAGCYPLTPLDFSEKSPYNTYLYKGLPPGPIGSPGVSAIRAARSPISSPYWFYLSDPKTGKTIWSETLDTHRENKVKYLLQSET